MNMNAKVEQLDTRMSSPAPPPPQLLLYCRPLSFRTCLSLSESFQTVFQIWNFLPDPDFSVVNNSPEKLRIFIELTSMEIFYMRFIYSGKDIFQWILKKLVSTVFIMSSLVYSQKPYPVRNGPNQHQRVPTFLWLVPVLFDECLFLPYALQETNGWS